MRSISLTSSGSNRTTAPFAPNTTSTKALSFAGSLPSPGRLMSMEPFFAARARILSMSIGASSARAGAAIVSRLAAPIRKAVRRAVGRSAAAVAQSAITCMRAIVSAGSLSSLRSIRLLGSRMDSQLTHRCSLYTVSFLQMQNVCKRRVYKPKNARSSHEKPARSIKRVRYAVDAQLDGCLGTA